MGRLHQSDSPEAASGASSKHSLKVLEEKGLKGENSHPYRVPAACP